MQPLVVEEEEEQLVTEVRSPLQATPKHRDMILLLWINHTEAAQRTSPHRGDTTVAVLGVLAETCMTRGTIGTTMETKEALEEEILREHTADTTESQEEEQGPMIDAVPLLKDETIKAAPAMTPDPPDPLHDHLRGPDHLLGPAPTTTEVLLPRNPGNEVEAPLMRKRWGVMQAETKVVKICLPLGIRGTTGHRETAAITITRPEIGVAILIASSASV